MHRELTRKQRQEFISHCAAATKSEEASVEIGVTDISSSNDNVTGVRSHTTVHTFQDVPLDPPGAAA